MDYRVTLNLGKGDFSQGCAMVTAQFWVAESSIPMQVTGSLPAMPELSSLYLHWQQLYEALYAYRGWGQLRATPGDFEIEADEAYPTDVSETKFKQLCDQLEQALNRWLNSEGFRKIDRQIRTRFTPDDQIQVIITAENLQLLQLPWQRWQLFDDYPKAESALSLPEYTRSLKAATAIAKETVNILAILGNSQGINIAQDQQLLQQLPNTTLRLLVEPKLEELNQQLWQLDWDILFFAGHSSRNREQGAKPSGKERGKFQVNATESLTIDQLKFALKKAIQHGLKLAIFNSCDGLGLAWDLADLQIPQVIVMREPVPDRVAQEFLKHFLMAFSSDQPLYLAVREAREKLQALETDFLCASWLPVICQNPAELPMRWNGGVVEEAGKVPVSEAATSGKQPSNSLFSSTQRRQHLKSQISQVLLTSVLATGCLIGVRSLAVFQPLELWAFDRFLQLRPKELPDHRLLIVTIDEADIQAQPPGQRQGSLSDQALDQLLKTLQQHQARVIGLDIYRDFPVSSQYPSLLTQLRQNKRLVAICKSSDTKFDPTGIAAPAEVPESRVGFSDFLEDPDGVLRRQLLFHTPDPTSPCAAPYAFNTRLAFRYLEAEGISPQFTPEGNLKLGQMVFQRLQERTGGYQNIDAAGNQILLNYRSRSSLREIAPQVSLTQVLQGKVRSEVIKDRIVIVGVTATSSSDIWTTPYGTGTLDRIPGVLIQAHMTSQLISTVLDGRSLIWVWHWAGEILWISLWSAIGGFCIAWLQTPVQRGIACIATVGILIGGCFFLFIQGGWVPLVPAGVAFLVTVGTVSYLNRKIDHTA